MEKKYTKSELDLLLKSKETKTIADALLYLCFNVDDIEWVEDKCIEFLENENEDISGLAATCLGHVARIHSKINKKKVLPVLREKLKDSRLSGRAQDALDDIDIFAKE